MPKSHPLVGGYLERISSDAFLNYPEELTALAGKQHGVYALYEGNHLYYVGLATNLRPRIKHHLKDRHAGRWDRFSLYLIRKADHIKELESLLLRIASPAGNKLTGGLRHAQNLRSELLNNISHAQAEERIVIFGERRPRRIRKVAAPGGAKLSPERAQAKLSLAPYVKKRYTIHATYKGREYTAYVRSSGKIRFNGKLYDTPTAAAHTITGGSVNGWLFWRYLASNGRRMSLLSLKKER
jgi:predicted GIY-YIG superfamily endonuclease